MNKQPWKKIACELNEENAALRAELKKTKAGRLKLAWVLSGETKVAWSGSWTAEQWLAWAKGEE